jgi:hypothetical protein
VNIQSTNNINFYEALTDIGVTKPYAVISAEELTAVVRRFVAWARMVATHPDLAQSLGDENTAHIVLATSFRIAVRQSKQDGIFPNVVLPARKFKAGMELITVSRQLEPEIGDDYLRKPKVARRTTFINPTYPPSGKEPGRGFPMFCQVSSWNSGFTTNKVTVTFPLPV